MFDFLNDILDDKEIIQLREILDFSLDPHIDLELLQEKIAFSSYHNAKLTNIVYKLRLAQIDLELAFDKWYAIEIHNVVLEYDGFPVLLKVPRDYDRELKKSPDYIENKRLLKKVDMAIKSLESKNKELTTFDWKVKGIIDIHKIRHNILY